LAEWDEADNVLMVSITLTDSDLAVSAFSAPGVAAVGESFDVNWTVRNVGATEAVATWKDRVLLSHDTSPSYDDVILVEASGNDDEALAVQASYERTGTIAAPVSVQPGGYFLLFVTDADRAIPEPHESNNVASVPLTLLAPDLHLTSLESVESVTVGHELFVEWTVANPASVRTFGTWEDVLLLSDDPYPGTADTVLASILATTPVDAGGQYSQSASVTIPASVVPGDKYLLLRADGRHVLSESDEANNYLSMPIRLLGSDLLVSSHVFPAEGLLGTEVEFRWTVTNTEQLPAVSGWNDSLYLSWDDRWDSGDIHLASQYRSNAPPLAAAASYEVVVSANLRDIEPGLRYLIVRIDTSGSLGEVDEANNTLVVPIALHAPDLVVQDAWAPLAVYAGQDIHITWTTLNDSPYDALAGWSDSLYLSQDAWFDNSDRHVASYSAYDHVPLVAGDDYTCERSIRIPSDTRAGVWYLVFVTDDWRGQWETNECNNERILRLEVSVPDLVLVDAFTPAAAATGATIGVSWTVRNSSSVPAVGCWSDAVYVSSDPMLDSSDQLLTDFYFCGSRLGAGESYDVSRTVAVPGTTPAGDKYLLVKTDSFRAQAEADEQNNLFAVPISIRTPDLAIRALEAPREILLGQEVPLAWTVENVGEVGALADWSDDLMISDDPVFSWDDRRLATAGAAPYTPLDPLGSYTIRQSATMPGDLNPGDKYLLLLIDHWGQQAETSEVNNVLAMPFRLKGPDLQPIQFDCPDTAIVDQTVTFSWTVANRGLHAALGSWTDTIYVSADDRLDYSDQWVGSVYRPAAIVDAEHSYQLSSSFRLDNVGVGAKYVILAVDTYHSHGETNEANNVLVRSITLEAPDLAITTVQAPSVLALGTSFPLTWTVTNVGDVTAHDDWIDAVYLAAGATRDTVLSQLATEATSAQTPLAAGSSYTISRSLTAYSYTAGANYLLVFADAYDAQGEVTESNNALAIPITFTAPNLVVTDMTAPASAHVGETIEVTWTVTNCGNQPASVSWSDELSLSTSTYFATENDIVATVSADNDVPLDPDESYTITQRVTIPETVGYHPVAAAGDRYLVLATNRAQFPREMTYADNQWYLPLRVEAADVDLVPDSHTVPDTWTAGQTSLISWTVNNPGVDPGRSQWVDRVYLSNDARLDWRDTPIASVNVAPNPLAAGGNYTQTAQTSLPWWTGGGTRYLLIKIDADNGQSETDENNNLLVVPITVAAPNLIVTDVMAPNAAVLGEVIHVAYTVRNAGTVPASASWVDAIYLSGDARIGNDVLLDDYDTSGVGRPVPAGKSFVYERDVEIRNTRSDDQFLLVVTDLENDQAETDESDNCHAVPIHVTAPDLIVSAATAPATALSESTMTISYTVTNQGDGPALAAWRDLIYLSRSPFYDGTLDNGETLVAEFAADPQLPLAADGYYTQSVEIALPGTAAGDRYLLFVTDADQQQSETNEHNNLRSVALHIDDADLTLALDPASDSGAPADRLTNISPIWLVGTAEPLSDVQLDVLGDGSVDVTTVADSEGQFAFEDLPLVPGQNRFVARGLSHGQVKTVPLEVTLDQERPWGVLLYPGTGSVVLEDPGYVELQWFDMGAAGLDVTTFGLSDIAVTGVTIDRIEVFGYQRVRYWYADDGDAVSTNSVTVMQIAGEVADRAGNANQTAADAFIVTASSLSGHVYLDVNNNGIMDPVELRLPNVPVTVHGRLQRTVLTDDSGFYEFTGLPPGVYTLTEAQPSAFLDGSDRMGAPYVGVMLNDRCENIALTGSTHLEDYNFGERGLRPELISMALFLASTPPPNRLVATYSVPDNRSWLTFTADRDAIVSLAVLHTTQPAIELYTSDFMPRAITTGHWLLNAPVFDGQSYIVHVAGGSDILQLAIAMTDNIGQDYAPHANGVFTNPALYGDVNADGMVTPLDALLVVNELNRAGPHFLLGPNSAPPFLDVAHDGWVSPIDALVVINYLNAGSAGEGETDATGDSAAGSLARVIDRPTDLVFADFDRSLAQIWGQPQTPLEITGPASTSGKCPPAPGQPDIAALPACPVGHSPRGRADTERERRRQSLWMSAAETLTEGRAEALCDIAEDVALYLNTGSSLRPAADKRTALFTGEQVRDLEAKLAAQDQVITELKSLLVDLRQLAAGYSVSPSISE
jgi:subtilase family serine protease